MVSQKPIGGRREGKIKRMATLRIIIQPIPQLFFAGEEKNEELKKTKKWDGRLVRGFFFLRKIGKM